MVRFQLSDDVNHFSVTHTVDLLSVTEHFLFHTWFYPEKGPEWSEVKGAELQFSGSLFHVFSFISLLLVFFLCVQKHEKCVWITLCSHVRKRLLKMILCGNDLVESLRFCSAAAPGVFTLDYWVFMDFVAVPSFHYSSFLLQISLCPSYLTSALCSLSLCFLPAETFPCPHSADSEFKAVSLQTSWL